MGKKISMGKLEDLTAGKVFEKKIMAKRVAVFNHEGNLYGLESDCKHMRASLATGKIADGVVKCPWHGWRYELKTGQCINVPGADLKQYDVEVVDGEIFLII